MTLPDQTPILVMYISSIRLFEQFPLVIFEFHLSTSYTVEEVEVSSDPTQICWLIIPLFMLSCSSSIPVAIDSDTPIEFSSNAHRVDQSLDPQVLRSAKWNTQGPIGNISELPILRCRSVGWHLATWPDGRDIVIHIMIDYISEGVASPTPFRLPEEIQRQHGVVDWPQVRVLDPATKKSPVQNQLSIASTDKVISFDDVVIHNPHDYLGVNGMYSRTTGTNPIESMSRPSQMASTLQGHKIMETFHLPLILRESDLVTTLTKAPRARWFYFAFAVEIIGIDGFQKYPVACRFPITLLSKVARRAARIHAGSL